MIEYISHLVANQFPDLYREEGPQFVAFLRAYYEFLEQEGYVVHDSRSNLTHIDIDTAGDAFLSHFKATYMNGVPAELLGDARFMQKHILDLYRAKGSTEGMRLFFRLLFNEEIDVYLPSVDILKASDGKWIERRYLEIDRTAVGSDYVNKTVYGVRSGASALVESHEQILVRGRQIDLLYVSNISGTFFNDEFLYYDGQDVADYRKIVGSPVAVNVVSSDLNFERGDTVYASDGRGRFLEGVVANTRSVQEGFIEFSLVNGGLAYSNDAVVNIVSLGSGTGANFSFTIGNTTPYLYNTDDLLPYANVHLGAFSYSSTNLVSTNASNAVAWPMSSMTVTGGVTDPLGGSLAFAVRETVANDYHSVSLSPYDNDLFVGNNYAIETVVKPIERGFSFFIYNADYSENLGIVLGANGEVWYTGNTPTSPFVIDGAVKISNEHGGYFRINIQFHVSTNVAFTHINLNSTSDTPTFTGNTSRGFDVYYGALLHLNDTSDFAGANLSSNLADTLSYTSVDVGPIVAIETITPGTTSYDADVAITITDPYTGDTSANVIGSAVFGSGIVSDILIRRSGYGYVDGEEVSFVREANTAMTAEGIIDLGGVGRERGFWRNEDGFLNSIKRLQDSYYYQEYSYDLLTTRPLQTYIDVLKHVVHPVGNEVFGSTRAFIRVDYPVEVIDSDLTQE